MTVGVEHPCAGSQGVAVGVSQSWPGWQVGVAVAVEQTWPRRQVGVALGVSHGTAELQVGVAVTLGTPGCAARRRPGRQGAGGADGAGADQHAQRQQDAGHNEQTKK